jgi:L-asparaginase
MILILTTGGTIDKVYHDARSEYAVGEPQAAFILREAGVTTPFQVRTLMQKDSLEMTDSDRDLVAAHVRLAEETRILITHGTDTMADTARTVAPVAAEDGKTVVLVGSLSPALHRATDADFNLGFAFAAVQTLPPGVYVAMNGQVFDAARVRKNREANRFEQIG